MLYFAYGSNMDPRQMAKRCPGASAVGKAVLRDYRLTFTWDSVRWGGGVGSVEPKVGAQTWGVLWELEREHVESLDAYEQVGDGVYVREEIDVEREGAPITTLIYLATDDRFKMPSRSYMRALIRGARAHDLPADYIRDLEAVRKAPAP